MPPWAQDWHRGQAVHTWEGSGLGFEATLTEKASVNTVSASALWNMVLLPGTQSLISLSSTFSAMSEALQKVNQSTNHNNFKMWKVNK